MTVKRLLQCGSLVVASMAILPACQAVAPAVPSPFTLEGTILNVEDVPRPITLSLVQIDPDAVETLGAVSVAAIELYDDTVWALAQVVIGADGSFSVVLPEGDDLPEALMFPAAEAIEGVAFDECTITADDPEANVSYLLPGVDVIPFPAFVLGPFTEGSTIVGFLLLLDADITSNGPILELQIQTWVYADAPVHITGSCSNQVDVDEFEVVVTFDLELDEGWNAVVQHLVDDGPWSMSTGEIEDGLWNALIFGMGL